MISAYFSNKKWKKYLLSGLHLFLKKATCPQASTAVIELDRFLKKATYQIYSHALSRLQCSIKLSWIDFSEESHRLLHSLKSKNSRHPCSNLITQKTGV